ncbi:MAG: site-2 protease family protein [Candidatus Hydrogenedentes bacterium]|nr:site-2 protease family protein [Candidatus Hydrogenedentota bacterium]
MDQELQQDILFFGIQYFCFLFSLSVHEAAHAVTADRCGDPTGRLLGRITLNPIKHIDPIGTVVMPLLMFVTGIPYLFGWAKPVPFNPNNLKNFRRDPALIAAAGPISNVLIAVVTVLLLRLGFAVLGVERMMELHLVEVGLMMVAINLLLFLFNLIPVPPLDGGHILRSLLPSGGQQMLDSIGPFGILIAIFVGSRFLSAPLAFLQEFVIYAITWGIAV